MTTLQWKRGTDEAIANYAATAHEREIAIDVETHRINLFDGNGGKVVLPLLSDIPTQLTELENDVSAWGKDELTKLSQLENDAGFWSQTTLTKVSQLENDSGFKTAYCSHCEYCAHCSQCANCHNCTTINCTTINCQKVRCNLYDYCTACACSDDN